MNSACRRRSRSRSRAERVCASLLLAPLLTLSPAAALFPLPLAVVNRIRATPRASCSLSSLFPPVLAINPRARAAARSRSAVSARSGGSVTPAGAGLPSLDVEAAKEAVLRTFDNVGLDSALVEGECCWRSTGELIRESFLMSCCRGGRRRSASALPASESRIG